MRIILPALAGGLGWWLIWGAIASPETWPYLVAYFVAGPLLMYSWGWAEERLGYAAVARPEEDTFASTVRDRAKMDMTAIQAKLRARTGQTCDDLQPGLQDVLVVRRLEERRSETALAAHSTARVTADNV